MLIVDHREWSSRSLESVLSSDGCQVILAHTVRQAVDRATLHPPDLVFISNTLPNGDGIALCREFRGNARFGLGLPILVTSPEPCTRTERLAALRAGAWEFVSYPIDAEELLLRVHSFWQARLDLNRAREQSLIDELTGLYNLRGLERRAEEITSSASRERQAVACIVLASSTGVGQQGEAITEAPPPTGDLATRAGAVLRRMGRVSDAIGRLGALEFAIVAPGTDGEGAVQLATRLAQALRTTLEDEGREHVDVRAGYDVVPNAGDTSISPHDLLVHASSALQRSRGLNNGAWIQPFQPE